MQEATFLILTALAAQPRHGYGIIQSVEALSEGDVKLRPGTLYGALDRLVNQGLITVEREEAIKGRLRRYYQLSQRGTTTLAEQTERLSRQAAAARGQLGIRAQLSGGAA
ncbi:MAG: helix-turn-helix transcriptional regulator [Actinoplanes sp.]